MLKLRKYELHDMDPILIPKEEGPCPSPLIVVGQKITNLSPSKAVSILPNSAQADILIK